LIRPTVHSGEAVYSSDRHFAILLSQNHKTELMEREISLSPAIMSSVERALAEDIGTSVSPEKTVLIPDLEAGCSLASSITANDVRLLRQRYPGVPVVTYVNTSAAVKAESDICCTSANAVEVVESLGAERVIFLPDEFLGRYVAGQTNVEIILWKGHCEVHERFTAADVRHYKNQFENIEVLAHPECPPEVLAEVDFVGSTAGMIDHLNKSSARRVVMITECSMSDNVAVEFPHIQFTRPCNLCPHMKRITLSKILRSLQTMEHKIEIDASIAEKARLAVKRMVDLGKNASD